MAELDPQRESLESSASAAAEPMSLEQLSGAFADMLGVSAPASEESPAAASDAVDDELAALEAEQDGGDVEPQSILEAMLFVGRPDNQPLTSRLAASLMRGVEPDEIDELVAQLNSQYRDNQCPYEIVSVGAGYRLELREKFDAVREKFYGRVRQAKLSQAAVEVLAIVVYNQPITADELNKLRGTPSGPILAQLVRRQLLRIERGDAKPRTPRYFTTARFLQIFGLTTLDDLPRSQELDKQ